VNTVVPYAAGQQPSSAVSASAKLPPFADQPPPRWRRLMHPLTIVCAVQAALSLTLVWSNTAFADEAQYLVAGELEWAHWLHGAHTPPYLVSLPGSPVIYSPLGAIANGIGGLAGARILSLAFMLGATIMLYFTALSLFGRAPAITATALWALSEPTIRLAFATFDPMSILLTTLSAWFIVRAAYRGRRGAFLTAAMAALALALANATAYSGVVIDPVVITFAFLVWLPSMRVRQASFCAAWLAGASAIFFGLLMVVSGSWVGLTSSIFNRSGSDHQSVLLVLYDSWGYSGLIAVLAVVGVLTAFRAEDRQRFALVALLGCTGFVVPVAQFDEQTAWALDKHLAYGIWFAVMAAAYGLDQLIQRLPGVGRRLAALFCIIALAYPAVNSWNSAWKVYHTWPNAHSFIDAFAPVVARSAGLIDVSGTAPLNVAEYYTSQGREWQRWIKPLSLDPVTVPRNTWEAYYARQLHSGKFGVISLFYATTLSSTPYLPGNVLLSPDGANTNQELLGLVADYSGEPGLTALTLAVEDDSNYRLVAAGPYDSTDGNGVYAIWQRKAGS
jgi:hypothetical protein